jgi:hypothetical protein
MPAFCPEVRPLLAAAGVADDVGVVPAGSEVPVQQPLWQPPEPFRQLKAISVRIFGAESVVYSLVARTSTIPRRQRLSKQSMNCKSQCWLARILTRYCYSNRLIVKGRKVRRRRQTHTARQACSSFLLQGWHEQTSGGCTILNSQAMGDDLMQE